MKRPVLGTNPTVEQIAEEARWCQAMATEQNGLQARNQFGANAARQGVAVHLDKSGGGTVMPSSGVGGIVLH